MKFGILVSTMNQKDYNLIKNMNIKTNATVINQIRRIESEEKFTNQISKSDKEILWVNTNDVGLSKSRNLALDKSSYDIALLADDDLVYVDNVEHIVKKAFLDYPEADIITFMVDSLDGVFKKYGEKTENIGYLKSMKKASVEIAINLNNIKEKDIYFNELFGSGSKFKMGEDNIFLFDCLKKGLKIKFVPEKIADLKMGESTWFNGFTNEYFYDLGTIYQEMSSMFSVLLILQFAIRKYPIYKDDNTFFNAIRYMLKGRSVYKKNKENIYI